MQLCFLHNMQAVQNAKIAVLIKILHIKREKNVGGKYVVKKIKKTNNVRRFICINAHF